MLDAADPAKKAGLQVAIGGYVGQQLSKPDTGASDKIGIAAAMVILLLVFGSAVAAGLPILTAVLGLLCGLSVVTLLSHIADIPTTAPTLATMIGLAVGIDYSLFIVTKHRAQVAEGMEVHESIARALATAGGAVLFAGGTVAISLLALVVAGIPLVTTLGYTSAIAVAFAILGALTLLPALFALLGTHVSALKLPFRKARADEVQSPLWTRLATGIANHRWPVIVGVLAILLALSIPTLSMHLGQEDVGAEPTDTTARQAYDLIGKGFGEGTNGPFLISTQLSKPAKPNQKNLNTISQNEKQLQQQQQQIEQQALLEGATQQQARAGGKAADAEAVQRARQQEEEGRAAGDRPAPPDPAQGPPEDQGRRFRDAAAGQQAGNRGRLHADCHDRAVGHRHRGPGLAPEGHHHPGGDQGPGHDGLRGWHHSRVCRPRREDHQQAPAGHPGGRGAQLPGAAGGIPLPR